MADIQVQVCYAGPDRRLMHYVMVPPGTTVQSAIALSGVLREVPEIDLATCRVGVYGKLKTLDTMLREHDRVEIYRPLIADPKEARRRRAGKRDGASR